MNVILFFSSLLLLINEVRYPVIASVILHDPLKQRAVELSAEHPTCKMYSDKQQIQEMMKNAKPQQMFMMRKKAVSDFMNVCRNYKRGPMQSIGFVYPGTKWCGQGNIATDYDDLGEYEKEDQCCRKHDHCPVNLLPGDCLQNICNDSPFTRSHCGCDQEFRECLEDVGSETSNTLGVIFFNVVKVTCFEERCNSSSCWQEFQNLPPFTSSRRNKYLPGSA